MPGDKCTVCNRYVAVPGSTMCAPCSQEHVASGAAAPASCAQCLRDYFTGMQDEPPGRRYHDPLCPKATPWCSLYDGIVKRIAWAEQRKTEVVGKSKGRHGGTPGLARSLNNIRKTMQLRLRNT